MFNIGYITQSGLQRESRLQEPHIISCLHYLLYVFPVAIVTLIQPAYEDVRYNKTVTQQNKHIIFTNIVTFNPQP